MFECVDRFVEKQCKRVASLLSNKITRIDPFWQGQNSQIDLILYEQCQQRIDDFIRATAACFVAVEHQRDAISVTAQELHVVLAQRGSQHGHHMIQPLLMGHEAIGVAFHHHHAMGPRDAFAGHVQVRKVRGSWKTTASRAS